MKFGACITYEQAIYDHPINADIVELAAWDLKNIDDDLRRKVIDAAKMGKIKTYSSNGLFPGDIRLTGDVNKKVLSDYCDEIFYRLAELNIKTVVFGSAKAKHVPDGFSREKAWDQLYELGHLLSDVAHQYGQTVVVEPLSYSEVNIVNTVDEAAEYCRTVNRDNFKLLVDFYHFDNNNEDFASLERNKDLLYHTHIASQKKRSLPSTEADWDFFARCIKELYRIGYTGGINIEGGYNPTDALDVVLGRMKTIK